MSNTHGHMVNRNDKYLIIPPFSLHMGKGTVAHGHHNMYLKFKLTVITKRSLSHCGRPAAELFPLKWPIRLVKRHAE